MFKQYGHESRTSCQNYWNFVNVFFLKIERIFSKNSEFFLQIIQREILFSISVYTSNLYATNIRNHSFSCSTIFKMPVPVAARSKA